MSTIINTPGSRDTDSGFGVGALFTLIIIVVIGFLVYRYGIRPNRAAPAPSTINVTVPTPDITPSSNPSPEPSPAQ